MRNCLDMRRLLVEAPNQFPQLLVGEVGDERLVEMIGAIVPAQIDCFSRPMIESRIGLVTVVAETLVRFRLHDRRCSTKQQFRRDFSSMCKVDEDKWSVPKRKGGSIPIGMGPDSFVIEMLIEGKE